MKNKLKELMLQYPKNYDILHDMLMKEEAKEIEKKKK